MFTDAEVTFLDTCRPGIASGVTLHALNAARTNGMAPLRLPELMDRHIPPKNRAAMVENLPTGVVAWSEEFLVRDLEAVICDADKPASRLVREKTNTTSIANAMTMGIFFDGTVRRRNAPKADPTSVRPVKAGNLFREMTCPLIKGSVPPRLRKISANMLVATATCGSMPHCIITGTVMREVPPVTTLMTAVKKNTTTNKKTRGAFIVAFSGNRKAAGGSGYAAFLMENRWDCHEIASIAKASRWEKAKSSVLKENYQESDDESETALVPANHGQLRFFNNRGRPTSRPAPPPGFFQP